ncbi:tyrosine-type recombinase/integrase [Luminiphilus sp.]|nr:tyrosine-type recombinase/integrase [Luminiphilus sp.]MDC1160673.1 tyrosine-type recombinase/integrase [Luminiphilus sp.]
MLRIKHNQSPASQLLVGAEHKSDFPLISEILERYLETKGHGKAELFFVHAKRNIGCVISALGNKSIDLYSKTDAVEFRKWLIKRGLQSSSIQRIFSSVKAILNFAINEFGYGFSNPFTGVYIAPEEAKEKRRPITAEELKRLSEACRGENDDLCHLLAMLLDTGMRLSEAAGLHVSDIHHEHEFPYVEVRPNKARRLKTSSSKRFIPLVGDSLWAAQQVTATQEGYCFPRYARDGYCNGNSASAALGKWMKNYCEAGATVHGIRHAFRDRLRAVEAPVDLIDQLGGWSHKSIGETYGRQYSSPLAHVYMSQLGTSC